MKTLHSRWHRFYHSRFGQYLLGQLLFIFLWKIFSFEFAIVAACGTILGELYYQTQNQ